MKILLVEDDRHLGRLIQDELIQKGYEVTWVQGVQESLRQHKQEFHLAIVDLNLPDGIGFEVVSSYRCPIIIMSALSDPQNRLRGVEMGVYDFIPKPFLLQELFLKIEKVLGEHLDKQKVWRWQDVVLDLSKRQIITASETHLLNKRDFRLLEILTQRYPQVVSRDEIIDYVYGQEQYPSHRTIDNAVVGIRQMLGDNKSQWIRSVRGEGYQWMREIEE
jgi:two-component system, OmpR family, phosphate regulon response regulator PhoB